MLSVFKQPLQEKGSKLLIFNKSGKLRNWMGFFIAEITALLGLTVHDRVEVSRKTLSWLTVQTV
jgi:hypothetical protein